MNKYIDYDSFVAGFAELEKVLYEESENCDNIIGCDELDKIGEDTIEFFKSETIKGEWLERVTVEVILKHIRTILCLSGVVLPNEEAIKESFV